MKNPPFDSLVWGSLRLAPIRPLHFLAAASVPETSTCVEKLSLPSVQKVAEILFQLMRDGFFLLFSKMPQVRTNHAWLCQTQPVYIQQPERLLSGGRNGSIMWYYSMTSSSLQACITIFSMLLRIFVDSRVTNLIRRRFLSTLHF